MLKMAELVDFLTKHEESFRKYDSLWPQQRHRTDADQML